LPVAPCSHKVPPLDLAAVAASSRHTPTDSTREGTDVDLLYEEAEALRLQTPPDTERNPAPVEHLWQGLHPAGRRTYKAPILTESILFHGLVVDHARSAARGRSKRRAARDDSYSKDVPSRSAATPATMASEAGAEAP